MTVKELVVYINFNILIFHVTKPFFPRKKNKVSKVAGYTRTCTHFYYKKNTSYRYQGRWENCSIKLNKLNKALTHAFPLCHPFHRTNKRDEPKDQIVYKMMSSCAVIYVAKSPFFCIHSLYQNESQSLDVRCPGQKCFFDFGSVVNFCVFIF